MSKALRILVIFLLVDAAAIGVYFLIKATGSGGGGDPTKGTDWFTMDAYYQPASEIEEIVKKSYEEMDLLPLQVRNFGSDTAVLKKFRGAKLAGASRSVLEMTFQGVEDWAIVEIWFKGEEGREIRRTILYILSGNEWKTGDSGRLAD